MTGCADHGAESARFIRAVRQQLVGYTRTGRQQPARFTCTGRQHSWISSVRYSTDSQSLLRETRQTALE